jgi:chaperonin GroES
MVDVAIPLEAPVEEQTVNMAMPPLEELAQQENIMDALEDAKIAKMASECVQRFKEDEASRSEWLENHDEAMNLALQVAEDKSYPFNKASNVIYPLVTTAAVQFGSRAYPAIIAGREVVKAAVIGDDSGQYAVDPQAPDQPEEVVAPNAKLEKGGRLAKFMNFQLLELEEEWEEDTDRLVHYLPIAGCAFRKRWWDGGSRSKFITAKDLVVNYNAQALDTATNIGEVFELQPYEVKERVLAGRWSKEYVERFLTDNQTEAREFVEFHTRYDLDEDGYPEPYILWFDRKTGTPVRVTANVEAIERNQDGQVARVTPNRFYTKYDFIPNPDGGFYGIGFGILLGPINRSVNTAINQLNDAAHWQNAPSGYIGKGLRIKGGDTRHRPGEFKRVDAYGSVLKDEIYQMQFDGPSAVTFQLLGLMINSGKDISSVQDIMLGGGDSNTAPTTALAMVEQAGKQFSAIYKRIHRALKEELRMLRMLNARNVQEIQDIYMEVLDDPAASPEDFEAMAEVVPVTDPQMVSETTAMAKAQIVLDLANQGRVDQQEATRRVLLASGIEDIASLEPQPQGPSVDEQVKMLKIENDRMRIALQARELEAKIANLDTESIKNLAQAEAEEEGVQINAFLAQLEEMKEILNDAREMERMAREPANPGLPGGPA